MFIKKTIIIITVLLILSFSFYRSRGFRKLFFESIPEIREENTINYKEAYKKIGEEYWVKGKIDNVFVSSGNNYFLNFCSDYRNCPFYAVIFKENVKFFDNIENLEKKEVYIFGEISLYNDRAQIIIEKPSQINYK